MTLHLLILLINESHCFNLDVNNYIRHEGQDGSMFGFSVALHQEQQRSWLVQILRFKSTRTSVSLNSLLWFLCGGDTLRHIFFWNASLFKNRKEKKSEVTRSWRMMSWPSFFFHRSATRWVNKDLNTGWRRKKTEICSSACETNNKTLCKYRLRGKMIFRAGERPKITQTLVSTSYIFHFFDIMALSSWLPIDHVGMNHATDKSCLHRRMFYAFCHLSSLPSQQSWRFTLFLISFCLLSAWEFPADSYEITWVQYENICLSSCSSRAALQIWIKWTWRIFNVFARWNKKIALACQINQ